MTSSYPQFPVERIPLPSVDGYTISPGEAVIRTDMESGAARSRRRFSQTPARVSVRWNLRPLTYAIFESWFKHEILDGAEWFELPLLAGIGMATTQARFTKAYQAKLVRKNQWEVTGELEIRNRPTLTQGALGILLDSELEDLQRSADNFDILVNQHLPTENW